ncbi:MAG: hypothetical protein IJ015_04405 [Ruminococcus sp.]|nr:hypothetical protein [Ruminococcus sp.]
MLTSLYIKTPENCSKVKKFFSKFLFDTMYVEVKRMEDIRLKTIEYISRSGSINFKKLDKEIGSQKNRLLCNRDVALPKDRGYKRFEGSEYKERLCTNLGLSLLSALSTLNLSVGLIDENARFLTLPEYLLRYTDAVVVVSNQYEAYKEQNENLLHEIGAPIRLSKSLSSLYDCDLIIAPDGINESANTKSDALILTTRKPKAKLTGTVIYDYHIELDEKYQSIMPKGLTQTYFASALYTLTREYILGSKLPSLCVSENKVHTVSSLKVYLENIHTKNLT